MYKKRFYVKNDSSLDSLAVAIEKDEIINFLNVVSQQLDKNELPIEDIVESLRSKMVYLSETQFSSRNLFNKNKSTAKPNNQCPWYDIECKQSKTLLNNARKSFNL